MRSANFSLAMTSSRSFFSPSTISGCTFRKASRESLEAVSRTVPSARIRRALTSILSELAWVPQLMPEALLATIPPTMQLPIEAGSGPKCRPKGARCWFTLAPTMPGCSVTVVSSWYSHFSQCLPATTKMLSVMACPEREVPAARKVTGRPIPCAKARIRDTSFSSAARRTT